MESTPPSLPDSVDVAVVGAGLAGLICARALARAGRDVHLFEAGDAIGGRMRTITTQDGFRLDAGFHVLLTGYPSVQKEIDLARLRLRDFQAGCVVALDGRLHPLSEPQRGGSMLEALRFPLGSLGDKSRLASLRARATAGRSSELPDRTAMDHLRALGFSSRFIDSLFVPFFGGVFADRSLSNSSRYFESILGSFMRAPVGIPADGIDAIPKQVAESIPPSAIHTNSPVATLRKDGARVSGVTTGETQIRASAVVLASGPAEAIRLGELPFPEYRSLGTTAVYFAAPEPPTEEKRLFVRADPDGWTNQFAVLTNIAPSLAPPGQHLLMGSIVGVPEKHDGAISEYVRAEMAWWFPHARTHLWRWLRSFKVPHSQWAFPPGMAQRLPKERTDTPGLFLAGDFTREPSVEGAIRSGLSAAEEVLRG